MKQYLLNGRNDKLFQKDCNFHFRFDKGNYQGVDESNVKLEVTCIKFPPARKVSKMLNGLGDAM